MNVAQNPEVHKDDISNGIALEHIFIEAIKLYNTSIGRPIELTAADIDELRELLPWIIKASETLGFRITK